MSLQACAVVRSVKTIVKSTVLPQKRFGWVVLRLRGCLCLACVVVVGLNRQYSTGLSLPRETLLLGVGRSPSVHKPDQYRCNGKHEVADSRDSGWRSHSDQYSENFGHDISRNKTSTNGPSVLASVSRRAVGK